MTGGARRVGRAICLALARGGCDIVLTSRKGANDAATTVRAVEAQGARARAYALDLEEAAGVEGFARNLLASLPRVDVVVHNASVYEPTPMESLRAADALRHFRVNALGPLILTRELAPTLARSPLKGGGAVVCLCDIHASDRPRKGYAAYAMSKAALEQMVRVLAVELSPGIRVNGVAPGVVAFPDDGPESEPEMQRSYLKRVPLSRPGTPEEAAEAVRWLALEATYTTGEVLRVDGGRWVG